MSFSDCVSVQSDYGMVIVSSDSFWEPGNYKRTTKRIEDGYRLCNDLVQLVQERAEIEKAYARSLKSWSRKWADAIEKGPEYATTEAAWKGILVESERLSDVHSSVKEELQTRVVEQIRGWQNDTYHKNVMHLKEKKVMEEKFKAVQKPWAKLLGKVNKAKADYHNARKTEKSVMTSERNAICDNTLSPDQVKKLQDRVARSHEEVEGTQFKYERVLKEITTYNPKYIEDMRMVFDKCQEMEGKRLRFFKDVFFAIHKCLNVSEKAEIPQIYEDFHRTISNADYTTDLRWWSNNHGADMGMNWPIFEEYSEELRKITKSGIMDTDSKVGIILVTQRSADDISLTYPRKHQPSRPASLPLPQSDFRATTLRSIGAGGKNKVRDDKQQQYTPSPSKDQRKSPGNNEEEWDDCSNNNNNDDGVVGALVDHGEPGILVTALYDYDGTEDDELSFKRGDQFENLEDKDEQGWCKGRKDGRVGFYPAMYVEVVD